MMIRKIEYKLVHGIDEVNAFTTAAIGWELHRWMSDEKEEKFIIRRELDDIVLEAEEEYYNSDFFKKLNLKWDSFKWSVRTCGALKEHFNRFPNPYTNLKTEYMGELILYRKMELLAVQNFGRQSLNEIDNKLKEMGLALNTPIKNLKGWKRPNVK